MNPKQEIRKDRMLPAAGANVLDNAVNIARAITAAEHSRKGRCCANERGKEVDETPAGG
jgi:hypothetical protein